MSSRIAKMAALLRAQEFPNLDATQKRARDRKRKPLRLPEETWDDVESLARQLQSAFPNRYVTLNSTIEFLIAEGLSSVLTSDADLRSKKIPTDTESDTLIET